jgi:ABC-type glycerol-3-phosphate transport system substrate-binding protein
MVGGMTYFNKTILEENGLTTPTELVEQNNWNLDSMWKLMEQIKSACGFSRPGTSIAFDGWVAMYGGSQMTWDPATSTFKTTIKEENTRKAIDYLMRGKDAGLLTIIDNHDDNLSKSTIALQICGAYGLRKSPGWFYTMDIDDLGFEVLPKLNASDADYPYTCSTRAYGICLGSKNPKGAAYFLRYFLNEDHYDIDQIFKNEDAKTLYYKLREKGDINKSEGFTLGVGRVTDPSYDSLSMVKDLIAGTAAQVSVNLDKAYNKCEGSVAAANRLVQEFIENQ